MKRIYTFLLAAMATTLCATAQSTGITHEYVDLGLPSGVRWATCNVGADTPEAYGNYYAWGETITKSDYSWVTYDKYGSGSNTLTKYCSDSSYGKDGFTDELTTLEAEDDAATQNWGGNWRMPTIAEWWELINNCDWVWTDNYNGTGVAGRIVASRTNGNSIFLPAAGCHYYSETYLVGNYGRYWLSSLDTSTPYNALLASFDSGTVNKLNDFRIYGLPVRPVIMVYGITVAAATNGAVTADKEAYAGQEITLTVIPDENYELDVLSVKDADNNDVIVSAENKFTMPASAVTVTATFKAKIATALETAQALDLRTENGRVICAQEFQIFTLTGQNITEMNGQLNGVYIVKVGEKAQNVVVK